MNTSLFTILLKCKIFFRKTKIPVLPSLLDFLYRIVFKCDIPSTITFGKYTKFAHHGLGCTIHPNTIIGNNCKIFHNVTIVGDKIKGPPVLGDNVYIGTGACLIGNVKIGNNVKIGAKSVITVDVPDNAVVIGIPARIMKGK